MTQPQPNPDDAPRLPYLPIGRNEFDGYEIEPYAIRPRFEGERIEEPPRFRPILSPEEGRRIFGDLPQLLGSTAFGRGFGERERPAGSFGPLLPPLRDRAKLAARLVSAAHMRTFRPLVDALRGTPRGAQVEAHLRANPQGYTDVVPRYIINADILSRQRALSVAEREYVDRISDLTVVNPYIVAAGAVAPEVTNVVLDAEFARRSAQSRDKFPSGTRVPLVVVGDGPHSIIASAAILVERPDLTWRMPVISRAKAPGGVFQGPNGRAHKLNSKRPSAYGEPFELPPTVTDNTLIGEGGLFPQTPGQRNKAGMGRTNSINRLTPWMVAPETMAEGTLYLDNWQLALAVKEQAAITMPNRMGEMEIVRVEPAERYGDYRVVMRDLQSSGEEYVLTTPGVLLATGLGKARQSVRDTERFRGIIAAQERQGGFPLYSDAMTAFNHLADRTKPKQLHGKRIGIIGSGDSAATLLEALSSQIEGGNFDAVEELYIISNDTLSERPRYAAIADLLERRGRKNILRYVTSRVDEIVECSPGRDGIIRQVALTNPKRYLIDFGDGKQPYLDHVIDATGFESELQTILAPLLPPGTTLQDGLQPITLRNNPFVAVGEVLKDHPSIAIVGTASNPRINEDKRAQYPLGTQDVLSKISENVVSLGLRGPDTTAAVTAWLRERGLRFPYELIDPQVFDPELDDSVLTADSSEVVFAGEQLAVDTRMVTDSMLLTPLLLGQIAAHRLAAPMVPVSETVKAGPGTRTYDVEVSMNDVSVRVTPRGQIPAAVLEELAFAAADPHFRAYASVAMKGRRSDRIRAHLAYRGGRLSLRDSFVQAA